MVPVAEDPGIEVKLTPREACAWMLVELNSGASYRQLLAALFLDYVKGPADGDPVWAQRTREALLY